MSIVVYRDCCLAGSGHLLGVVDKITRCGTCHATHKVHLVTLDGQVVTAGYLNLERVKRTCRSQDEQIQTRSSSKNSKSSFTIA